MTTTAFEDTWIGLSTVFSVGVVISSLVGHRGLTWGFAAGLCFLSTVIVAEHLGWLA